MTYSTLSQMPQPTTLFKNPDDKRLNHSTDVRFISNEASFGFQDEGIAYKGRQSLNHQKSREPAHSYFIEQLQSGNCMINTAKWFSLECQPRPSCLWRSLAVVAFSYWFYISA